MAALAPPEPRHVSVVSSQMEAAARRDLIELQQEGLRVKEPRACGYPNAHARALTSLERASACARQGSPARGPLQGRHVPCASQAGDRHGGGCRQAAFGDDPDIGQGDAGTEQEKEEEALAMPDLLELESCGFAVRWARR